MDKQASLFDGQRSEQLKRDGMALAADNAGQYLDLARQIAREIALAHPNQECDADKVGRILKRRHGIDTLGPAAGSLFRGKEWEFTGRWVKSKRITNHSRMIRVWRLVL